MTSISDFEHGCKLSAFIKSLDSSPQMQAVDIDSYLDSVKEDQKDTVKEIYSELKSRYSFIEKQDQNIKSYCCSYLNYWLDKKREDYITTKQCINEDAWLVIEKLWGTLKNSSVSCKRQHYYSPLVDMEKCLKFMVYCVNMFELQKHCEKPDQAGLKSTYCDNFNKYTNHYYTYFTTNVKCLRDTNKAKHYNWRFSDLCTLHNMAKTFPKYESSSQSIEDDKTRQQIKKCQSHEEIKTINCYMLDGVPVTLEELPTIDVIPLKYGVYAGSSFIGFFSLGLYLYKKTRHPSLIRSNSSGERKLNKNTDKQFSHEQEKKSNSKKKDYKFSYNPTQN
ncbi:VIR protein [Plasmodium vivax]|uniref:VIR protein n=1 Tax=Plasmodium vivax TaxID=5855 RepID=A0A1G4EBN6_PLAVI|nr:VIR protein [Plasmodium vivax]